HSCANECLAAARSLPASTSDLSITFRNAVAGPGIPSRARKDEGWPARAGAFPSLDQPRQRSDNDRNPRAAARKAKSSARRSVPGSVTVAQEILALFVQVRILAG